jgi:environmental stress-induced protein Ves
MIHLLSSSSYRRMAWKNGLGMTVEIAVEPEGAGLDAFAWRVSIADVGASGPFSTFAGCDRVIVQLAGEPMTLAHEGLPAHRLSPLVPHAFAGELLTDCRVASPARDFNVMTRRGEVTAEVVVHGLAPRALLRLVREDVSLAYVAEGRLGPARMDDTLVVRDEGEVELEAGDAGATVIVVAINPAPGGRPSRR